MFLGVQKQMGAFISWNINYIITSIKAWAYELVCVYEYGYWEVIWQCEMRTIGHIYGRNQNMDLVCVLVFCICLETFITEAQARPWWDSTREGQDPPIWQNAVKPALSDSDTGGRAAAEWRAGTLQVPQQSPGAPQELPPSLPCSLLRPALLSQTSYGRYSSYYLLWLSSWSIQYREVVNCWWRSSNRPFEGLIKEHFRKLIWSSAIFYFSLEQGKGRTESYLKKWDIKGKSFV